MYNTVMYTDCGDMVLIELNTNNDNLIDFIETCIGLDDLMKEAA